MNKFEVLKQYFGHTDFRNGQADLIDNIIGGRDVLGIMPTGAGKSICYQVPALILEGITIVISPLISLMKDQVNALVQSGVPAAFINSSLTFPQYNEVFRRAKNGMYKIIYVAPERLVTDEFIEFAENTKIAMVTVDEAHCVSQWGQDFRPSYLKISEFIERLSYRPVLSAFTATATTEVKTDISKMLKLQSPYVITTGFDRDNLYFEIRQPQKKLDALIEIMNDNADKCSIIYCSTRKNVELVCQELNDRGIGATRYHAGLADAERHQNQDDFLYDRKNVMVATNAFGMGIDKSNVSLVVHYNMPKNLEGYYQEAGRAGRDGEPANCILLYSGQDVRTHRFLIDNSSDENQELSDEVREALKKKDLERLKEMTFYSTTNTCLRGFILKYFGENPSSFCGHCSNCNTKFETVDVSIQAQKIVSCVYRIYNLGQGRAVGKALLTDILHGSKAEKVTKMGYDKLTTYGLMEDTPVHMIRKIIDFLIENDYLSISDGEYPVVTLTNSATRIVRDKIIIEMKLPKEKTKITPKEKLEQVPVDNELLLQLKELRGEFAKKTKMPAYIIFTDASLRDMCRKLPEDDSEFLGVSGVGKKKYELYGEAFLTVIKNYAENAKLKNLWTEKQDTQLRNDYQKGMSLSQMSLSHKKSTDDIRIRLKFLGLVR